MAFQITRFYGYKNSNFEKMNMKNFFKNNFQFKIFELTIILIHFGVIQLGKTACNNEHEIISYSALFYSSKVMILIVKICDHHIFKAIPETTMSDFSLVAKRCQK